MSQDFPLGSMSADHFYALPLGVSLSGKQTYHWTLTIPEAAEMQYPVYVCGTWKRCGPGEYTS